MRQTEWKRLAAAARLCMPDPGSWIVGKFLIVRNPARWLLSGVLLESLTQRQRIHSVASPLFVPMEDIMFPPGLSKDVYVDAENAARGVDSLHGALRVAMSGAFGTREVIPHLQRGIGVVNAVAGTVAGKAGQTQIRARARHIDRPNFRECQAQIVPL